MSGSTISTIAGPRFQAKSLSYRHAGVVCAPPEAVFPLLCPVREYDWIETWRCELLYSVSGIAEEGCIFQTSFADPLNPMTWVCSHYEPPHRIQYAGLVPGELVMRLRIDLEPADAGARLCWTRNYTGLSESGNQRIEYWKPEWEAELMKKLDHFLRTGEMLKAGSIPKR